MIQGRGRSNRPPLQPLPRLSRASHHDFAAESPSLAALTPSRASGKAQVITRPPVRPVQAAEGGGEGLLFPRGRLDGRRPDRSHHPSPRPLRHRTERRLRPAH